VMDGFCFYECVRCHNVYFGGKKECEDNSDQMQNPNELLCPNCIATAPRTKPGSKNCPRHGYEFIEYKCRFCCSEASYFCWGTTHFCVPCYKRQNRGDHMTNKKAHQLPQCPGPTQCPLGIKHPPNGQEFVLGCSLCLRS
jgi:E3 ubiquitin-protein ligase MYCBP2